MILPTPMKVFLYLPSTEDQKTSAVDPRGGDHPPHTNMAQQTPTGNAYSRPLWGGNSPPPAPKKIANLPKISK